MNDKDLMEKLSAMTNDEIEQEAQELINGGIPKELVKPLWEDEMLKELIENTTDEDIEAFCKSLGITSRCNLEVVIKENPAERKRQLMRLEKEMLVDMVFNLESRNEMLVNNLLEVEKMYNKLKDRVDELETEVFSLRNQNKLWQCIVEDYKKKEKEEKENG